MFFKNLNTILLSSTRSLTDSTHYAKASHPTPPHPNTPLYSSPLHFHFNACSLILHAASACPGRGTLPEWALEHRLVIQYWSDSPMLSVNSLRCQPISTFASSASWRTEGRKQASFSCQPCLTPILCLPSWHPPSQSFHCAPVG